MKKTLFIALAIFIGFTAFSQKYTISGYVEDAETGERLIGANVFDANMLKNATSTNVYGYYSLTVPKTDMILTGSFVGYSSLQNEFKLNKDTVINIKLEPSTKIGTVVVSGKRNNVESPQMSTIDVPLKTIKNMPVLLGEVDIMKTIQLLPGVQSGTEGTSGIYVRGGGPDQNLILLDGVPVYNVNHLFGFFSVFNADAVSNVTLIKGGFPARYGGRLSSVIDIRMKEGNMQKFSGNVSIGLISSKFMLEGPIVKGKTSFAVSARRTYLDALVAPGMALYSKFNENGLENFMAGYYFYDMNAKINHKFSDKSRLYLSVYGGNDKAYTNIKEEGENSSFQTKFNLNWGNVITALRWNYVLSPKLFMNTTATYSRFNFATKMEYSDTWYDGDKKYEDEFKMGYSSGIYDVGTKIDFDYNPNPSNKIRFGAGGTFHTFRPGVTAMSMSGDYDNIDTTYGSSDLYAREYAIYLEDEIRLGSRIKVNVGGNLSFFNVRDTTYFSPEPRISARLLITKNWSVKAAYSEMQQNLHFLTSSTIGLPTDLWLPATDILAPQHSTQYAAGTVIRITPKIDLTIEGFYKEMTNLIEYKEGESMFASMEDGESAGEVWEQKVEQGDGLAYGGEVLLKKDIGKLNGWIGYTLSWTNRTFENIAFGETFPYRYDRRHDISIVMMYKFNDRIDVGATWVYGTGNAVTLAQQRYVSNNGVNNYIQYYNEDWGNELQTVEYYGKRNNYRLPAYHRLDLGINFTKQRKRGVGTWSFSVYNAYNHQNPFFVQFERNWRKDNKRELIQYSIFPIIPSVSYSFKF